MSRFLCFLFGHIPVARFRMLEEDEHSYVGEGYWACGRCDEDLEP